MKSSKQRKTPRIESSVAKAAESQRITAVFVLESMRRWWQVCLPIGLVLSACLCFLVWYTFDPVYESRSVIIIEDQEQYVIEPGARGAKQQEFVKNELAIIRSPLVLEPVLRDPEIALVPEIRDAKDQEAALARLIDVRSAGGNQVHYITCRASSPDDAKKLCDEVASRYFDYRVSFENKLMNKLIELLHDESDRSEDTVKDLQDKIRATLDDFEVTTPSAMMNDDGSLVYTPLHELQRTFETNLIERDLKALEISELEREIRQEDVTVTDEEVSVEVEKDQIIRNLRTSLSNDRAALATSVLGRDHPDNRQLKSSIEKNEQRLDEELATITEDKRQMLIVRKRQEREDRLEGFQREHRRLIAVLETLNTKIESHNAQQAKTNQQALNIEFLRDDLQNAKDLRDQLKRRWLVLSTEQLAPQRVSRADGETGATHPNNPVEAIPIRHLGIVGTLSMLLPFVLAFLWELRVKRVSTSSQLENQSELQLIGEVAVLPTRRRAGQSSRRLAKQMRLFEESVDSLRTYFTLSLANGQCQVISVTSAVANEGKTTIASQLAISLGRASGQPVLLIDCDLRAPDIHFIFGLEETPGICEVIRGEAELDEAIEVVSEDNLHVLPAGRLHGDSPHQLIGNREMLEVVDRLRQKYSYIVFDTSPVLSSSESLVIARNSDATIASVMRDVSRMDQVKKLTHRLATSGVEVSGLVLSGVPQYKYAYYYGEYYGGDS